MDRISTSRDGKKGIPDCREVSAKERKQERGSEQEQLMVQSGPNAEYVLGISEKNGRKNRASLQIIHQPVMKRMRTLK